MSGIMPIRATVMAFGASRMSFRRFPNRASVRRGRVGVHEDAPVAGELHHHR